MLLRLLKTRKNTSDSGIKSRAEAAEAENSSADRRESHNDLMNYSRHDSELEINF